MALVNEHFLKMPARDLAGNAAKAVKAFSVQHPRADLVSLAAGGPTLPLCPAVAEAMHKAVGEMATHGGFRGYGPVGGYGFLREAIVKNDFLPRGIHLDPSEIFVGDGARSDIGNIQELVRWDNSIGVTDPLYPAYVESNVAIGRAGVLQDGRWSNVAYLPCTEQGGFLPQLPDRRLDIVYLCYPNNPTGSVMTKDELRRWVSYALRNDTLIFFDAAYEAYIQSPGVPHSIYEVKGARKVAVEFHSYSMAAGFAGLRCGYTVVPKEVTAATLSGSRVSLHALWHRRQSVKSGGAGYVSQRAAEATYTPEGKEQVGQAVGYYMGNARLMRRELAKMGLRVHGGEDSPYLWVAAPHGVSGWRFFEQVLYNAQVVCAPGVCFGPGGEGYVRFAAFAGRDRCAEAMRRLAKWMG